RLDFQSGQLTSCNFVSGDSGTEEEDSSWLSVPAMNETWVSGGFQCPAGWEMIDSTCFLLVNNSGTWLEGRDFCSFLGGSLATISSQLQQSWIRLALTGDTWLGLRNTELNLNYTWLDGSPYKFTSWAEGEPSNTGALWVFGERGDLWVLAGQEHCVAMSQRYQYLWNDAHCDHTKQFLCSVAGVPDTTTTTTRTTPTSITTTPINTITPANTATPTNTTPTTTIPT
ncbi:hypothetical protein OTU49_010547, partial [Cherax quadricarinatus]